VSSTPASWSWWCFDDLGRFALPPLLLLVNVLFFFLFFLDDEEEEEEEEEEASPDLPPKVAKSNRYNNQ
jgi:hypothetical protein